jgi:hypothetical protein
MISPAYEGLRMVVGVPICKVISGAGDTNCPVHFSTPLDVRLVYASSQASAGQGSGDQHEGTTA